MKYSLRVICDRDGMESVKKRVTILTDYLCFSEELMFRRYWKDDNCVVLEISGNIESTEYSKLQQYVLTISGANSVSVNGSSEDWECAHFTTLDELHNRKNTAFIVFNIIS